MQANKRVLNDSRAFWGFRAFLLTAFLCFCALTQALGEGSSYSVLANYTQMKYSYENGLSMESINDILQTADGHLWIAGYTGLLRYSGSRFEAMAVEGEEAPLRNIMTLFEDSQNRLWIGTNDKGILLYADKRFARIAQDKALSVTGFAEKKDGTILFSTKDGIFAVAEENGYHPVDESVSVDLFLLDARERLWIIDLYGQLTAPPEAQALLSGTYHFSSLYEDGSGNVWLGTEDGTVILLEKQQDAYRPAQTTRLNPTVVNGFCADAAGNVWVFTDAGLGLFDQEKSYRAADGAKISNSLSAMIADHEGSLWVASTRNGLLQMIPSVIKDYNFAGNLGSHVTNAAIAYQAQIYIATDDGLFILDANDQPVQNELTDMLQGIRVRCLTADTQGNLWIAAYSRYGVLRYAPDGQITVFNTQNGLSSDRARMVCQLQDGTIAVGTADGLCLIQGDSVVKTYAVADGLTNSIVLCLAEDADGKLYIGTDGGGIFVLEDGQIRAEDVGGLDSGVILRLLWDEAQGALWIATGSSFYCYDGALHAMPHITDAVSAVFDIIPTPDDRICLLATNGIVCASRETLLTGGEDLVIIYNRGSMPFHITANSWNRIDEDGNLFLCGSSETGRFNVQYLQNNASPVRLVIDRITVDGASVTAVDDVVSIGSDAKRLTIKALSPHFGFEERISFEYYLEGFDESPVRISADEEREISYTNLRGGEYVFHIRAQNGAGEYAPEQRITVRKARQWHEYPLAWVGIGLACALVILALLRAYVAYRTRQLIRKQEEYRRITDQAILTISNAIDAKDSYTEGHSERVAAYSIEVANRLGMSKEEQERLYYIALLHDIGKIGITDTILNKPERLTDAEFHVMRSHAEIGGEILKDFLALPGIGEGARAHHEKYDGTGYPRGIKGEDISLVARIIGVCDTYDAMSSNRSYRGALNREAIINEIKKYSGSQFDPHIAQIVIDMINDGFMDKMERPTT